MSASALLLLTLMDSQPGLWFPGATPMEAGKGHIAMGAAGVLGLDEEEVRLHMDGTYALSDKTALSGVVYFPDKLDGWYPLALIGVRSIVVEHESFHLAPFGVLDVIAYADDGFKAGVGVMAGVAMEGGWEKFRLDASVPLIGIGLNGAISDDEPRFPGGFQWRYTEYGLSWMADERNVFRVGARDLYLWTVTYRTFWDLWFLEASAAYGGVRGELQLLGGVRF